MSAEAYAVPEAESLATPRTREILDARRRSIDAARGRGWLMRRMLCGADVAGLLIAFAIVQALFSSGSHANVEQPSEVLLFLATLPVWIVVAKLYGLYDRDEERTDHSTIDDVGGVFHMVTVGAWIFFVASWATGLASPHIAKLVAFWGLAVVVLPLGRAAARAVCRRQIAYLQNTIIVGAGTVGQLVARKLTKHPEYGINLVGFVDAHPKAPSRDLSHVALLGTLDDLRALVDLFDVDRVIVAFSTESHEDTLRRLRELGDLHVQVDIVPRLFELVAPGVSVHTVEGLPLLGVTPPRLSRSSAFLKRQLDIVGAALGLLLLAPLFVVVALVIKLDSGGPVFFRQTRMGTRDRTFRIVKFRTMSVDAEARKKDFEHLNKHACPGGDRRMFKIDRDPRITRVGRAMRRFSIDELPQLWNVLAGEMSLVGPRPLILAEHAHVREWGERRLDLRPGITGLWQVLGRDEIPFDEMVKLDYLYVTTWSLAGDVRLLLRTLPAVVRRGA